MDPAQEQQRDFLSERVLKGLFLSDWYAEAMTGLDLPTPTRMELDRIADESEREMDAALDVFKEWQSRRGADDAERMATFDTEMMHVTRQGFLRLLVEAKDASAQFFQDASLTAPRDLSDRFAQLGAHDFDHAMRLRKLLVDLYYVDSPYPSPRPGSSPGKP